MQILIQTLIIRTPTPNLTLSLALSLTLTLAMPIPTLSGYSCWSRGVE